MLDDHVRQRLAQLVAENQPRRARVPPSAGATSAWSGGQPGYLRADPDEEEDDDSAEVLPPRASGPAHPVERWRLFGLAHLKVVAALLVVGLLCAGWGVLRARPVALASTPTVSSATVPKASGSPGALSATPSASPAAAPILVHVLGAVRRPGVVTLGQRARVRDAIAAAGGLTGDAAPGELNLAQLLQDGQQVVIGTRKKPRGEVRTGSGDGPGTGSSSDPGGSAGVLDLNAATETQLEDLPGVGPVTAGKIAAWRQQHGRFSRVEELQEVDGIGPKTFAQIAPHVRV